jgi:probable FeS assembly SUF system protein SufT
MAGGLWLSHQPQAIRLAAGDGALYTLPDITRHRRIAMNGERVELQRDCDAVAIPAGHTIRLTKGTEAYIAQSLGGSFTLQVPSHGGLYRLQGADADAIGKKTQHEAPVTGASGDLEAQVWEQLKTCFDPEIPVNIVDLGLIYDLKITPADAGGNRVDVKMTLTAQGCGMGVHIAAEAQEKILGLPGVKEADVQVVWDPPWTPHMISPEGRQVLGMD